MFFPSFAHGWVWQLHVAPLFRLDLLADLVASGMQAVQVLGEGRDEPLGCRRAGHDGVLGVERGEDLRGEVVGFADPAGLEELLDTGAAGPTQRVWSRMSGEQLADRPARKACQLPAGVPAPASGS